jgi:FkbM family methyltransferase
MSSERNHSSFKDRATQIFEAKLWRTRHRLFEITAPVLSRGMPSAPDVEVPHESHGSGTASYVLQPQGLNPTSVVYSFGVGNDISFDISLIQAYGVSVHAFDPTDNSARFLADSDLPAEYHFHQVALSDADGTAEFHAIRRPGPRYLPGTVLDVRDRNPGDLTVETLSLQTIMERLGHTEIDVLKMDIEGGEYRVIDQLARSRIPARQIVLEFHPYLVNLARSSLGLGREGWDRTREAIGQLRENGYSVLHVSDRGTELSFIRTD